MRRFAIFLDASLSTACASARPGPVATPDLGSGITSSIGGGTRALGNQPSAGVTTRTGPAQ